MKLIILSLVVWRLAYMLTEELGPYDVFKRLRKATKKLKFVNLDCFYCISVPISIFLYLIGSVGFYEALALSSIAIFIYDIHERIR